jgi:sec-independent protein translocase protein TatC
LWAFVAPGLYKHERRFALPLVVSSVLLFYSGVAFAYFVIFPFLFALLTHAAPAGVHIMTDITEYLDFVLVMFLAIGLAFEIPVAIVLMVSTGLVRIETLGRNRGYVLLGIFVQAAVITPPDVISLTVIALPMYALYEIGMLMARVMARTKIAERRAEDAAEATAATDKKNE